MKIAICEDDSKDMKQLKDLVDLYLHQHKLSCKVDCYANGNELLQNAPLNHYQLILLDIYLTDVNGVDLARQLLSDTNASICFCSSCPDFAVDAFQLNSIHYILKPAKYEDIQQIFKRCEERSTIFPSQQLSFRVNQQEISVPQHMVTYVEKFDKVAIVHTNTAEFKTYQSLSVFESQLDSRTFIRPHRSYIVNMNFIDQMNTDTILLKNGQSITLSRKNRNYIRNTYFDFLFTLPNVPTLS